MVERGSVLTAIAVVMCGALVSLASAQPKAAPGPAASKQSLTPIGATQVMKIAAETGFVDDIVAYDNQRIAYVVADTSTRAELHVVQFGCATCSSRSRK